MASSQPNKNAKIGDLKCITRCNHCGLPEHWWQQCPHNFQENYYWPFLSQTDFNTQASYAESAVSTQPLFHQKQVYPNINYYSSDTLYDKYQDHFNSYEENQPSSSFDFLSFDIIYSCNVLASSKG